MSRPWLEPEIFTCLSISVGGVAVGLLGLYGSRAKGQCLARIVEMVAAVLLASFAFVASWFGQPAQFVWLPLGLAVLFIGVAANSSPQARTLLGWLWCKVRSPRGQMATWALLIVGSPILAFSLALPPQDGTGWMESGEPDLLTALAPPAPSLQEVVPSPAFTDAGNRIATQVPAMPWLITDWQLRRQQARELINAGLHEHVIRLPNRPENSNCHGWVFTGGSFWIKCEDVPTILRDNEYKLATGAAVHDVVVYSSKGAVVHTGVVRQVGDGMILVESKWGRMGCFLHLHDKLGYRYDVCAFYRSSRPGGHLLRGVEPALQEGAAE